MNDSSEKKLHFLDYWSVVRYRWAVILIVFLLVVGAAGVTCYFLPREYLSKVLIEVKPDDNTINVFGATAGGGIKSQREQGLTQKEFQILMSKVVLYTVIDDLNLLETWSEGGRRLTKEEAYYRLLKKMSTTKDLRLTDMIQIEVYSTDPQEAANIANAVAKVYQDHRKQYQNRLNEQALAKFGETLAEKEALVNDARETVRRIREEKGIIDLNPEGIEPQSAELGTTTVRQNESMVTEAKSRVAELRAQLDQIDQLKPDELMTSLPHLNIQDPTITRLLPLYQEAVLEEARLVAAGLGDRHPKVNSVRAQKQILAVQLNEQVKAIRASLATRLKVAESALSNLTNTREDSKGDLEQERKNAAEYQLAKEAYIQAKKMYDAAKANYDAQRIQLAVGFYPAKVWEDAEPSIYPARPNVPAIMSIAVVAGLLLGVSLAFFLEYLDTSVKTVDEVEELLKLPVLGVIPKGISPLVNQHDDTPDSEAYRILQTNLELNRKDTGPVSITLISGGVGEGKSTTLNNLAFTYAKAGHRVLIVDADLRRSSQHLFFGMDKAVGLADILTGACRVDDALRETKVPNLWFIPAGHLTNEIKGITNSSQMAAFLATVKSQFDYVFLDSPPILGLSDASVLTSLADITVMVIQYRRFPRSMLERVRLSVLQAKGNLIGAVLNNVDSTRDTNYQYYTQYYTYYRPTSDKSSSAPVGAGSGAKGSSSNPDEY